jgi:hypothetical protein
MALLLILSWGSQFVFKSIEDIYVLNTNCETEDDLK